MMIASTSPRRGTWLMSEDEHSEVSTAISAAVVPKQGHAFRAPLVSDSAFIKLLELSRSERILGLLISSYHDKRIVGSERQVEILSHLAMEQSIEYLQRERVLGYVAKILGEHELDYRIIKGLAVGPAVYVDRFQRQTGDIDLLVPAKDLQRASSILRSYGFEPIHPFKGDRHAVVAKAHSLAYLGVEVDVHQRYFESARWTFSTESTPFARRGLICQYGNRSLLSLDVPDLMVSCCLQLDQTPRLALVADYLRLRNAIARSGDTKKVEALLTQLGVSSTLLSKLDATARQIVQDPLAALQSPSEPGFGRSVYTSIWAAKKDSLSCTALLPNLASKVLYLRELVWPSAAWRDFRSGGIDWAQ